MSTQEESPQPVFVVREGQRPKRPPSRPVDRLLRPVLAFAQYRMAGAILLIFAALVAVVLANSPWSEAWLHTLHISVGFSLGDYALNKSLTHWINDGLMGVFFFLVGLEIKREMLMGELTSVRAAALPALAALGGMLLPAGIYAMITLNSAGSAGWGIPMATDIAFALGVLAFLGTRIPPGLRVFLTALAIVDDIGAVMVIAIFYTDTIALFSLVLAGIFLLISYAMNRLQVRSSWAYLVVGFGAWLACLQSGVHATIAALLMAFSIPARTWLDEQDLCVNLKGYLAKLHELGFPDPGSINKQQQQTLIERMAVTLHRANAPLLRLEHGLAPFVGFFVLPLFALANSGVPFRSDVSGSLGTVTVGVFVGLLVGKPLGIVSFTWLGVQLGWVKLPQDIGFRQIVGVGLLSAIGFTMALFIGSLAFGDPALVDQAKLGVMIASVVAGIAGYLWLRAVTPISS